MSCSRTGMSICSRMGSSRTVTWNCSLRSSHAGACDPRRQVPLYDGEVLRSRTQFDDVSLAKAVARDVGAAAVHIDVTVTHELASLRAGGGPTGAVDDVVEPKLKEAQHVLAGHALPTRGLGKDVTELPFGEAVAEAGLLLLLQLQEVFGDRAAPRERPCSPGGYGRLSSAMVSPFVPQMLVPRRREARRRSV